MPLPLSLFQTPANKKFISEASDSGREGGTGFWVGEGHAGLATVNEGNDSPWQRRRLTLGSGGWIHGRKYREII